MKMDLDKIIIDESIYPRSAVDMQHVSDMVSAIETGAKLPPLTVEAGTLRLVDGRHRYEAYRRTGLKTAEVTEKSYPSEADLFADAVRLNIGHGKRLDHYSVKGSIARLMSFGYEPARIAEIVLIPAERIETIVRGFAAALTGETVPLKGGLQHKSGETLNVRQIQAIKRHSGQHATFYARQIINLLENDLWPKHLDSFTEAMDRLIELWDAAKTDMPDQRLPTAAL